MRYLTISVFLVFIVSCRSYTKKHNFTAVNSSKSTVKNPYFSDLDKDYLYKANIEVYSKSFGGILVIKKINSFSHRVVFTTEMGNTMFDFLFENERFKVNYILEDLNKKILLNILEKDFRALVKEHIDVLATSVHEKKLLYESVISNKHYFYHFNPENILTDIVRAANGKEKMEINFSNLDSVSAKNIQILHHNIKLKINLKSIN